MAQPAQSIRHRDQASRLRVLARRRVTRALRVAVLSGKGGVGKSNLAVNLSICLAARGLRVTLVDVDMGLANADLLLDVQPRYTLAHLVSGARSVEQVILRGPGGIGFIAGSSGACDLANLSEFERQHLLAQLRRLDGTTEIVVSDCGAGISKNVMSFALDADELIVVTTPQPPALADAYATIKSLHRERCAGRVALFVNMAPSRAAAAAAYDRVAGVAQKFLNYAVADGGYMVHDRNVELAVQARCPFVIRYPGSNASACVAAAAEQIARRVPSGSSRGGVWQRVAGMFV